MLRDLIRPFAYLTIKHPSHMPLWVNWIVPVAVAVGAGAAMRYWGLSVDLFGDNGLVARVLGFVQTMVGFYIACLAVIAAFNSEHMDKIMPGKPPTMTVKYNGVPTVVQATRRRFLCSMFAYLTALTFVVSVLAILGLALAKPLGLLMSECVRQWAKVAVFGAVVFVSVQLTTITFWGLFYMGERMLTPD